jgi:hypothetical protein
MTSAELMLKDQPQTCSKVGPLRGLLSRCLRGEEPIRAEPLIGV